jgi:hypothetical protein
MLAVLLWWTQATSELVVSNFLNFQCNLVLYQWRPLEPHRLVSAPKIATCPTC